MNVFPIAAIFGGVLVGTVAVLIGILAILVFASLGALVGAITGFIVGIIPILGPLVVRGFDMVGIHNADLTAIGAMLGFVAGFFRTAMGGIGDKK